MTHECNGGGREVPAGPPPAEAMTCPVCGRETKIEAQETDGDLRYTIAQHQKVGA
jgi:rRNA maturation endonuclease Nob1